MIADRHRIRLFLLLTIAVQIGALTGIIVQHQRETVTASLPATPRLPDDVERLIKGYTYRETDNGLDIAISGRQVVLRGRELLGLRSNVLKVTYFECIRGTLRSSTTTLEFAASDAEWDTKSSSPLILRRNIAISVNGRKIDNIQIARLYIQKGIAVVEGNRKEVIHFR